MKHALTTLSLLAATTPALVATAATREATLRVDTTRTFQYVRGFGGFAFAATWWANLSTDELTTLYGQGSKQLGYNILRARIQPEEYASWGADNWGSTASVIKVARDLGATVFASAWTPPGRFTSNGENTHGHILPEHYGDYAEFLNQFIDRMVACGTDVDYISLQNEPDWEPDYEGCVWSAQHFIDFYRDHGPTVKRPLLGPESLAFRRALSDSILNDAAAAANLAIVGGHLYGGGNFDYPLVREKGKEKWMTEYLINHGDNDNETVYTWDDALLFARVVNTSMLANFNAWVHYALKSSYGMIGDGTCGTTDGEVTKRGYALSHFAKYVTGTTRVDHTLTDADRGLTVSAYRTATGDSIIVMAINIAAQAYDLTVDLPFLTTGYRRILTRQSSNMAATKTNVDESATPVVSVPAKSITTFVFAKSGDRIEPQAADVPPVWHDSLTQYNGECVIPVGWRVIHNGTSHVGTGQYTSFWDGSRPRLFFYSPESPIPAGILLTTSSASKTGIATFGNSSAARLTLTPGDYRLTWHAIGWQHAQKMYVYVNRSGTSTNLAYHSGVEIPAHLGGAWGTETDNFEATADTLDFTVTEAGNYELNWKVTYYASNAVDGACQALIGGIRLDYRNVEAGIEAVTAEAAVARREYFDLSGCRRAAPATRGIYLERVTTIDGRTTTRKVAVP